MLTLYRATSVYIRLILLIIAIASLPACVNSPDKAPRTAPNVVFFLVDDMGWTDAGVYGSEIYQTPAIDRLAADGMRFDNAYASHPLCVGSRFSLMSGKYFARNRPSSEHGVMSLKETTLAEAFKEAGYQTFFAGKWHLGEPGAYPENQGFDINVGGHRMGAPASYFPPFGDDDNIRKVPGLEQNDGYLTDILTEKTVEFIQKNKDKPFFAYLSHYAVHTPLESKQSEQQAAQDIIDRHHFKQPVYDKVKQANEKLRHDNASYAGMLKSVDDSLSRIVETLEKLGLSENTIIVMTSDNGGDSTKMGERAKSTSNAPLKAGKCWLYEGGIRVPLIVKWPGKVKAGLVSNAKVIGPDHYPTLLEMAGITTKPEQHLDGVSYASVLANQARSSRKAMFWHFPKSDKLVKACGGEGGTAVQQGDYKLIDWYGSGKYELYNLKEDLSEAHDLSQLKPEKAQALLKKVRTWRKEMNASLERLPVQVHLKGFKQ